MNEYVGKSPLGLLSESGEVNTPVFPPSADNETDGFVIVPESLTPTIVPLIVTLPPTKSDDLMTPSTSAVPISPSALNVESVS